MSTRKETVAHILECLPGTRARAMFGEYGLYLQDRVVALVCDDRLYVKPTPGALAVQPLADLAPPYPGAKDHILADELLDEPAALMRLLDAVLADLPPEKPKRKKG